MVCFHGQQTIEKYLKSILAFNHLFIEKTHALDYLCSKTVQLVPQLAFCQDELSKIDAFAVQIRYPGQSANKDDAKQILKLTTMLRKFMRLYLVLKEKKRS